MKKINKEQLLELFDPSVHGKIEELLAKSDVNGAIVFENHDMCSSNLGARTAVIYGDNQTYKTAEQAHGKWINDLPSQRQYADSYYEKAKTL